MQKMILGNFQIRKCEKTCLLETKTRTEMSVELKNQKLWNKTRTSPTNANGGPAGTGDRGGCPRPVDDTLPRLFGTEQRSGGFCHGGHYLVALGARHGQVSERGGVRVRVCVYVRVCAYAHVCVCMHTHVLDGRRNSII